MRESHAKCVRLGRSDIFLDVLFSGLYFLGLSLYAVPLTD